MAIEFVPFKDECIDLFCQHLDYVKKLKGENDAYKDQFERVYKEY